MIDWLTPGPLFNPVSAPVDQPLMPWEIFVGPFGLIAFLPLAPLLRVLGRRWRESAIPLISFVWVLATCGPSTTGILVGWTVLAAAAVHRLAGLRQRGRLGARLMIALVWIGLCASLYPLWLYASWNWVGWYDSRVPALHNVGFAYLLLRMIAWGVDAAREPERTHGFWRVICWLAYPPVMRLGPVMLLPEFEVKLAAWRPASRTDWREVGRRFAGFLIGGTLLGVTIAQTPRVAAGAMDFFAAPEQYRLDELLRVWFCVPTQIYFILWTYNELAAACAAWVGIPVENNFDWLPRARSVREFWRRWHITVGVWLRNYIYFPLGGNRGSLLLNYGAVFGFCAVWHGAAWSFLAWAATQVVALFVQKQWDRFRAARGWEFGDHPIWVVVTWIATMVFQATTILMFADFEHMGLRLLREIGRRVFGG